MNAQHLEALSAWRHSPAPVAITVDGGRYVVATNNQALLAIANADCDATSPPKQIEKHVPGWIRDVLANGAVVPWRDLAEFIRKGHESRVDCGECSGSGYSLCEHCDNETSCKACRGRGHTGGQDDYVLALGAPFNAALIGRYVAGLDAEMVRVMLVDSGALAIAEPSGAWVSITMPLVDSAKERATRSWPEATS